ncbi:hypothetical protein K461DRAFT_264833 [Myriangium duriaei CBS 260.36]|uniref:N-acetyltransferase domain-containing protein n=1 Tax=Myriangium duriaei CBS 260.36 TaxID=1168546 RepID=A0A9P4MKA6_9PEZI|nr:hypothetical protein K461DRAFT_264833 [Myriangium duriaei CBS 260.36]
MANSESAILPHGLILEPCSPATIKSWVDFANNVFRGDQANGTEGLLSVFYPDGTNPEIDAWALRAHENALPKAEQHYFLVRDPSQSDSPIVAAARWADIPASTPESRAKAEADALREREEDAKNPIPGIAYDAFEVWRPAQEGGQSRVAGDRAHVYLKILAVRDDWQGKGIGKALLRHVCESAGKKGMPVYLESSAAGVPVYLKVGFEDKGFIDFDAKKLGHRKSHKHLAMLWEPKGTGSGV